MAKLHTHRQQGVQNFGALAYGIIARVPYPDTTHTGLDINQKRVSNFFLFFSFYF